MLTTEANAVVKPIHPEEAMLMILTMGRRKKQRD
jgi:hypothetical protein